MESSFLNWGQIFPEIKEEKELQKYFEMYFNEDLENKLQNIFVRKKENNVVFFSENIEEVEKIIDKKCPFNKIVVGIIAGYYKRLENLLYEYSEYICVENCLKDILNYLNEKTLRLMIRTLIEDIHKCESEQKLRGNDSTERYNYYNEIYSIKNEHIEELKHKYPILFSLVDIVIQNNIKYLEEILGNIKCKWSSINDLMNTEVYGKITGIQLGKGDSHNCSKTVALIEFEKGNLIYKPRNLNAERSWTQFVSYINSRLKKPRLSTAKVLAYKEYGFMEKIEADVTEQGVESFENLGALLAVLYSLNASDCHYENIVFRNGFPVIVDAEMILSINPNERQGEFRSVEKAIKSLYYSVSQVGILSLKVRAGKDKVDVGIASLNSSNNKVQILSLKEQNTTSIYFEYEYQMIESNKLIISEGKKDECVKALKRGFEILYNFIMNNKDEYISRVLEIFKDIRVRVLYNSTAIYGNLLGISENSFFMQNLDNRKKVLSRIALANREHISLVHSEIISMMCNDIPYFCIGFDEDKIFDNNGVIIADNIACSPKDNFIRKINRICEGDLSLQKEIINDSYYCFRESDNYTNYRWIDSVHNIKIDGYDFFDEIKKMLDYLYKTRSFKGTSSSGKADRCFVGSTILNMDKDLWTKNLVDFDFYDGHMGLTYLYMYAAKQLNEECYRNIANEIFNTIYSNFNLILSQETILTGMHKGLGGYLITLCDFRNDFKIDVYSFLKELLYLGFKAMDKNDDFDFVGGNVGFVFATLYVTENMNETQIIEIANKIVYKYINSLLCNPERAYLNYSGYAHGLSSLIVLLYKVYKYTNDLDVLSLFKKLLNYDRETFFDSTELDWYRAVDDKQFSKGWCHGSPGILLGRIQLKKMGYIDQYIDEEINYLKNNLINKCFGNNLSYCHGDAGNISILLLLEGNENLRKINIKKYCEEVIRDWEKMKKPVQKLDGLMAGFGGMIFSVLNLSTEDKIPTFISLI